MITSSFSMYHFVTAQINSSDINVGNDSIQPVTPTSTLNNTRDNLNNTQSEDGVIENLNNFTIISGNWSTFDGSLHSSSPDNITRLLSNIILNSETPENVSKVITSFKVNNLNSTIANYAWIVYSFIDPDNYKLAGINIFNNAIYAIGYTMDTGKLVAEPFWPGIPTNLTYTPGAIYNLTLVNQGSSLNLLINGTTYMTQNIDNGQFNLGDVGLNYGRIQDISILDYKTEIASPQQLISNSTQRSIQ